MDDNDSDLDLETEDSDLDYWDDAPEVAEDAYLDSYYEDQFDLGDG